MVRAGLGWRWTVEVLWARVRVGVGLASVFAVGTACRGSPAEPEPEPRFEIGGAYIGPVTGASDEGTLSGELFLFVEHDDGALSGIYAVEGDITFGDQLALIYGDGTYVGMLFPGTRPSLALTLRNALCPDHEGELGGRFDPVTGGLELGGVLDVLGPDCTVLVSYQSWAYLDPSGGAP